MRHVLAFATLFTILLAHPASSQPSGALVAPPCDGDIANVRLTEITPTGTMAGYLKAVNDHRAWYKAHGFTGNEIFVSQVMVENPATKKLEYSKTEVLAFHIRPPFMPGSTGHDAAWDTFHDLYRKNSNIKATYNICMPKNGMGGRGPEPAAPGK